MTAMAFNGAVTRGSFVLNAQLDCASGEIVAVLGPNGSGKSTLLGTVSGAFPLARGALTVGGVTWDDTRTRLAPRNRSIGSMTASADLFPHLDARDNVAFGLRTHGLSKTDARREAVAALDRVGVAQLARRKPHELSSGQQQRVALARALCLDPQVIVLDEPFAAVDPEGRHGLRRLLSDRLGETNAAVLLVTHDPLDALTLADRLVFLDNGAMTQTGPPSEVVRRPRTPFAAGMVGLNLWECRRSDGALITPTGAHVIVSTAPPQGEPVFVAFSPGAVSLWPSEPHGSPRNSWHTVVEHIELTGTSARVHLTGEVDVVADVTVEAVTDLQLAPGQPVVATVKATDITAYS